MKEIASTRQKHITTIINLAATTHHDYCCCPSSDSTRMW